MPLSLAATSLVLIIIICLGDTGRAFAQTPPPGPSVSAPPSYQIKFFHVINFNDIAKVDGVEQTYYVDFIINVYYQVPGLNIPNLDGAPIPEAQLSLVPFLWTPVFLNKKDVKEESRTYYYGSYNNILNGIRIFPQVNETVPGLEWVVVVAQYSGQFKADLALQDFPYDSQTLRIQIETQIDQRSGTSMVFWNEDRASITALVKQGSGVLGWDLHHERNSYRESQRYYPQFDLWLPNVEFTMQLSRRPEYFVNKIISGIAMIVVMSNLCNFIDQRDTNRLACVMTAFLGIVSYLFVITQDVPKVAYLTRMDRFVNASFYIVFADFVFSTLTYMIDHAAISSKEADEKKQEEEEEEEEKKEQKRKQTAESSPKKNTSLRRKQPPTVIVGSLYVEGEEPNETAEAQGGGARQQKRDTPNDPASADDDDDDEVAVVDQRKRKTDAADGWYTTWEKVRRPLDFFLGVATNICFAVVAPLILNGTI